MRLIFFFLLIFGFDALALEATVDFDVADGRLQVTYEFSEELDEVHFGLSDETDLARAFVKFQRKVTAKKLVLSTAPLRDLLTVANSGVFTHDSGNTLIYSPFFDVTHGTVGNELKVVEELTFRFKGKTLHTRTMSEENTIERYLLLLQNETSIHRGAVGDIILDEDLPNRKSILEKIERSFSFLNEKLGPPKERPIVFFSYSSSDVPWYDGRVVIGSPVIMMAMSRGLETQTDVHNVVLHHALLSHEIAHHWNARNLISDGDTQDDLDSIAWIHEGGAEAIAHLMTKALYSTELGPYVSYMRTENRRECEWPDEDSDWEYNCGDLIYALALESPGVDTWKLLREILLIPALSEEALLEALLSNQDPAVVEKIRAILKTKPAPAQSR